MEKAISVYAYVREIAEEEREIMNRHGREKKIIM